MGWLSAASVASERPSVERMNGSQKTNERRHASGVACKRILRGREGGEMGGEKRRNVLTHPYKFFIPPTRYFPAAYASSCISVWGKD